VIVTRTVSKNVSIEILKGMNCGVPIILDISGKETSSTDGVIIRNSSFSQRIKK
jgi:hypothetical protein